MPAAAPLATAPASRVRLQRRTLRVLVAAQVFAGAGLAAGVSVGALLAEEVLGTTSGAGLPAALFTAGSAAAALGVGRLSDRRGRRIGLTAGYAVGAAGAAAVTVAAVTSSVPLFLVALTVYGAGTATNLQCRYAGADLADDARRGRAVSTVLVATTLGAVAGPNLIGVTGDWADAAGLPALSGPFVLASAAYGMAGLVLFAFLRPDPLLTARELALTEVPEVEALTPPTPVALPGGSIRMAATTMVITQMVMVAIMTMTPVHLRAHGHGLSAVGVVIAVHIACMYLPSPVTGQLADRFGRTPVVAAAGVVLLAAGLLAAAAPEDSVPVLGVALGLLGLGWNLGLVGGTAMVADRTTVGDRARVQGSVDLTVALAGATGGLSSGAIVASTSYATLSLAGGALALVLVALGPVAGRARPVSPAVARI